jgi:Tfp pilus assembly protein PilV
MIRLAHRFRVVDQAGMSVAEILIACVIIAVGLVGLLSAVPTASYGIQEGRQLSTAAFLANQRLNRYETRSGSSVRRPARPPTPSASRRDPPLPRPEAPPRFRTRVR